MLPRLIETEGRTYRTPDYRTPQSEIVRMYGGKTLIRRDTAPKRLPEEIKVARIGHTDEFSRRYYIVSDRDKVWWAETLLHHYTDGEGTVLGWEEE